MVVSSEEDLTLKAKPAMGASNSRPVTSKFTDGEENDIIKYAAPSIQGWRAKMEDVRAAILDLDGSTAFFGVCDGHGGLILFSRKCKSLAHGGNDVALYCARQFHSELAKEAGYHNNLANAMERAHLRTDEQLQQSDEWRELANPRGNGNWIQCLRTDVCANLWPSTEVEIGAKKYAKEGAGGERRAANSNSEWDEYEDISSPSSESDNKSKDPDYDPMEVGGAESGDSSGNGSSDNNNSSDGGKDEEDEEEEEEDDGDVDYEEEEEETPESQKYRISGTNEFNALNPDHHILEIDPLLPLIDKVSILREGRRRGFYFIRDIAYDEADNYINTHGIEDDSSDDD